MDNWEHEMFQQMCIEDDIYEQKDEQREYDECMSDYYSGSMQI